jgi:hypothetical protein
MRTDDLPPELIKELRLDGSSAKSRSAKASEMILDVSSEIEGNPSVDLLLIGIYRKYGIIWKRRFLVNKLYRMGFKSLPGTKGVYDIPKDDRPAKADRP